VRRIAIALALTGAIVIALVARPVADASATSVPTASATVSGGATSVLVTLSAPIQSFPQRAVSGLRVVNGGHLIPVAGAVIEPGAATQLLVTTTAPVGRTASTLTSSVTYSGKGGAETAGGGTLGPFEATLDTRASPDVYMGTKWDSAIDAADPVSDYPRPQLTRPNWQSLDGTWQFQGYGSAAAIASPPAAPALTGQILVPFPMESPLSGVAHHSSYSLYARTFTVPSGWRVQSGNQLLLHFGAVDYQAAVYVNGQLVATHTGGYTSFTADVTSALTASGPQQLVVAVTDTVDTTQPLGKQTLDPKGIFYAPSSGIWQTVWMEPVPDQHVDSLIVTPNTSNDTIAVKVLSASAPAGAVTATISTSPQTADGRAAPVTGTPVASGSGQANTAFEIKLPHARLWSPSDPFLYNLTVTLSGGGSTDTVGSYFGMRTFGLATVHGVPRVTLNGHPIYLDGVLDQGYWPDGLYTAPTDTALESDIAQVKTLGFNAIRKHMKVEPARWYYWADKLGMIVLQDMPLPTARTLTTAEVRTYQSQSRQIVSQLQDTTSIGVWILDNEHFTDLSAADDRALSASVKALDPSRLVDAHSGFFYVGAKPRLKAPDPGVGDIVDFHMYSPDLNMDPWLTSKYVDVATLGHRARLDGEWGAFRVAPSAGQYWNHSAAGTLPSRSLTDRIVDGLNQMDADAQRDQSGSILTQLTDVENEDDGLLTYNRSRLKVSAARVVAANRKLIAAGTTGIR
jgi:Glycosyl hydrolases family 2, sugar binding domain/Glycosyl hydrolases family 2/Glycosyl hydrolases family 2, TIM barrel domain